MTTTFDIHGEFGYELFAALPLINYAKEQGVDVKVRTSKGGHILYPNLDVTEVYPNRIQYMQLKINDVPYYRQHNHVAGFFGKKINELWPDAKDAGNRNVWEDRWSPPDLNGHYKGVYNWMGLNFDKPLLVISNKYQTEWDSDPVNYINLDSLKTIFELCSDKFHIIYNRPDVDDITQDGSPPLDFGDKELISKYNIQTVQDIANEYNLSYNEAQMAVLSLTEHQISTQGGNSALAAYFGGENIIYGVKGYEVKHKAYETFFPKLSGQKIYHTESYDDLIKKVKSYVK
jgi:hypothetical protein|tara:strand:- start:3046 stop:3909 length:864 start_codon:yes stop_codon:yes gene_type:complete